MIVLKCSFEQANPAKPGLLSINEVTGDFYVMKLYVKYHRSQQIN